MGQLAPNPRRRTRCRGRDPALPTWTAQREAHLNVLMVRTWPRRLRRTHPDYTFDNVNYLSTRDARPAPATYSFEDVLLAGLAEDGGLFVPECLPKLDAAERLDAVGRGTVA